LKHGILYVGRHALTAHVQPYDLDGHKLGAGFSFRGQHGRAAAVTGIDIDDDHRLWIADGAGERVRSFSLFGQELPGVESSAVPGERAPGRFEALVDVATAGLEDEHELLITSGGKRRHALVLLHLASGRAHSLRPDGDPLGQFDGLRRASVRGRMVYACEAGAGRVQVFRDGEFHYLFRLSTNPGSAARFQPQAVAPLSDGRLVIAQGGSSGSALLLVDRGGRMLRTLAEHGEATGSVFDPSDLALDEAESDHRTRIAVIDCDGDRVQVFTLDGACFGAFADLPRAGTRGTEDSARE
jgi:hypothetical protein